METSRSRIEGLILKAGVGHAERREDVLAEVGLERLAADLLDRLAGPVDVDAVLPALAGVEHQRRPQRVVPDGDDAGDAGLPHVAADVGVPDVVAEAGGVGQQVAQRDRPRRGAEPRGARGVEALQDLRRPQLGQHVGDRLVELQPALLDELHGRGRGHRLGHRRDPEHRVEGHGRAVR
jgi:hypothetical protein